MLSIDFMSISTRIVRGVEVFVYDGLLILGTFVLGEYFVDYDSRPGVL